MIELLVTLLILIVVLGLAYWAVTALAGAFGLPPQIVVLIQVLLVVVAVIYLLGMLSGNVPRLHLG